MALDPGLASPTKLKEIVVSLYTPVGLLLSKEIRSSLLEFLKPDELEKLAIILGRSTSNGYEHSLWDIKRLSIRRGSENERALLSFFELNPPPKDAPDNRPSTASLDSAYSLFKHQRYAARKVGERLAQQPRRVLLHMPTGSGKTRTSMHVISDHLREHEPTVVVWLAYSEELCEQAVQEFEKAWTNLGDRSLAVHRFWGKFEIEPQEIMDGFLVAGLGKTYSAAKQSIKFISDLATRTSLVVIDEAHSSVAETHRLILNALLVQRPTVALLGLTATPGRTWEDLEEDRKLAQFFRGQKVTLKIEGYDSPIYYLVREGYLADVKYREMLSEGGTELSERDLKEIIEGLDIPERILQRLADDEKRNLKIVFEIERLAKTHRRILVFAATTRHSELLATVLRTRGLNADSVTAMTPAIQRSRIIQGFKDDSAEVKIICNYGVLTTGFDAPQTSGAVIARPTKSLVLYSQMVGRAIRGPKAGGNHVAEIVTVIDKKLPGFKSVADAFTNWEDVWG